jgi:hypothetical protein
VRCFETRRPFQKPEEALHLPSAPKNSVRIDATPTDTMSSMLQASA